MLRLFQPVPSFAGIQLPLGQGVSALSPGRACGPSQVLPWPARLLGLGVGAVLGPGSSNPASGGEGGLGAQAVKTILGTQKALGPGAAWRGEGP